MQGFWVQFPGDPPVIGVVAQLVEHGTENPGVGGSIPPHATIFFIDFYFYFLYNIYRKGDKNGMVCIKL